MADAKQIDGICASLAEGKSLRAIAREMGLNESTLRYWFIRDDAAFAQSAHARELGCDALADECLEIADQAKVDDFNLARLRIDTRLRLIGKWSQRYGDKLTVDSHRKVTHSYDFDSIPDDDLARLESIVRAARPAISDQTGTSPPEPDSVH